MKKVFKLYTDGACKGNPGPGGWGVFIEGVCKEQVQLSGYESLTTNNRMEIKAAIMGLLYFKEKADIKIYTDSNYLKLGITEWIKKWKQNGWKNSNRKEVSNKDLWVELDSLNRFHNVKWEWVKAHDGNVGNEKADSLACNAIEEKLRSYSSQNI